MVGILTNQYAYFYCLLFGAEMKKLRVFKCPCGQRIERLVKDDVRVVKCECGKDANRTLSAPRCFGNTTGSSPSVRY